MTAAFALQDRVLISPRHLAGMGEDYLGDVGGPLIQLFKWHVENGPSAGHVVISSPDHSVDLDVNPSEPRGRLWTITHHEADWRIQLSQHTPVEAVAAVAQALPQTLGDNRYRDRIPLIDMPLENIAAANGWKAEQGAFTSPDGHCTLINTPDNEQPWAFSHSVYEALGTEWEATFSRRAPLLNQFFAHISTSEPVQRRFGELNETVREFFLADSLPHTVITPTRGTALGPAVHHAVTQIAQSAPRLRR
ncbi:hypothetical protein SLNWT_7023 [Streptomyces albus]|uniref:DUF317 domain-containing protein n=1 Tax=Streptomyces albus (strain ATCC 21838 / DSM 41398 / FERM P-419 / JCM 4703 / NBRC 107858) TaxID=1081613 RepID=A0A0B5EZZ8_STRA4|nr:hypothetical protein SLNWT_7023 [Streptomyces albus]AOU81702.1 hypothetical protein SLNHY_7011 [Streptomyces albus]AYN37392.1 hypothetical protein DUI70_6899 [Streptomyces albus]